MTDAEKREGQKWLAIIAVGALLLYYVKPRTGQGSTVIPPDEPSLVDWIEAGGQLYLL